jgi:hypothetical protein
LAMTSRLKQPATNFSIFVPTLAMRRVRSGLFVGQLISNPSL